MVMEASTRDHGKRALDRHVRQRIGLPVGHGAAYVKLTRSVLTPTYGRRELLDSLLVFYKNNGRWPTKRETGVDIPSSSPFVREFGSWGKALEAAQEENERR